MAEPLTTIPASPGRPDLSKYNYNKTKGFCIVMVILGIVLAILAASSVFGKPPTKPFIATLSTGGGTTLLFVGVYFLVKRRELAFQMGVLANRTRATSQKINELQEQIAASERASVIRLAAAIDDARRSPFPIQVESAQ